ncbi:hypothetical protein LTR56_021884 [Elasticomyces elasticus]|nr:hypothetical protein LTR56_021884 [Elasticomyces elasticus]KAK3630309.1 hypothetical protein LTR22_021571 [Elasticomyces elasticus]KAK4908971.1 hypothetical protein LTR49_022195 [Elasticomyces elasticus]KAK5754743.1 hypothetical protein LTS12_015154 [Elasticomyces elasticus]
MVNTGDAVDDGHSAGKKRTMATSPDDQRILKKSRVSRACDQCRSSREKCDGTQPICQTCASQRRECSYIEQPKKRGIQPNYIRTLEMTIAWLFRTYRSSERTLALTLASVDDANHRILAGKDSPGAEGLHQGWRNSIICRQVEQMLSGSTIEFPESVDHATAQDSAFPAPPVMKAPIHAPTSWSPQALGSTAKANLPGMFEALPTLVPPPHDIAAPSTLFDPPPMLHKLPANAWTLLEYYFAFTSAWLPITDKQEMLKLMYSFPADGLSRANLEQSPGYSELLAIMALSARNTHAKEESGRLQALTTSLMPSVYEEYRLSHIRTLLILCILAMTSHQWLAAWMLIGTVTRLLLAMAADNSQYDLWSISLRSENGSGTRLGRSTLAAFVLESTVALKMRLHSHVRPSMIETIGNLHEDGLEEWALWQDPLAPPTSAKAPARAFSTFNILVQKAVDSFETTRRLLVNEPVHPAPLDIAVLALLQNATQALSRRHPKDVLAACELENATMEVSPNLSTGAPARQETGVAYMSVPTHDSTETVFDHGVSHGALGNAPMAWSQSTAQIPIQAPNIETEGSGVDLFEALAMFEPNDSSQHPQFMQNLGFAPDLDLAEFFGADYQPSDPLLAYMQPSLFNGMGSSTGDGGADAG